MKEEIRLPELGEGIESGRVLRVLVGVGDLVARSQAVLEMETDKATVEVPCAVEGTVAAVHVREGDDVRVGVPILTVEAGPAAAAALEAREAKAGAQLDAEAEAEESAPAEVGERPARAHGPRAAAGEIVAAFPAPEAMGEMTPPAEPEPPPRPAAAAPSIRRLARELGVDIRGVPGTGPGGRISRRDVKAHVRDTLERAAPALSSPTAAPLPDFSRWGEVERRPMSRLRAAIAANLSATWAAVPQVTHNDRADITRLEELRRAHAQRAREAGGSLTITAILLKVVAGALEAFAGVNATIDAAAGEIVYRKYVHIGVAVETDRGLLVPVIRDAGRKSVRDLGLELGRMADKARAGKLRLEEMEGGCFTVTNLGGIGGTAFTPIVNAPESAILGVARASIEPVWRDGRFEPRLMLPLCLSYDHRLIDGADAARFLRWIVEALERPTPAQLEEA